MYTMYVFLLNVTRPEEEED